MEIEEIKKGILLLIQTSLDVQGYYEDDQSMVEALNLVPKEQLEQCLEFYSNRNGVIIDLRKELIQSLYKGKRYTVSGLNDLIDKHKKDNENRFKSYTKLFSIFYPPLTFYGHNKQREFVAMFVDKLIEDLELIDKVKITSSDFQGPRQQGSDRYWVAIYNKTQENQSSSLQIFIEFHHGKINYGVYRHTDKSYVKPKQQFNSATFDYAEMLNYFRSEKQLIINDIPDYSNAKQIVLGGKRVYKMSHGTFKAKKYKPIIEAFKDNNWIAIHENTKKGQSEHFKNRLEFGDIVYITIGSNELIGIARVVSREYNYVPSDIVNSDEWIFHEVEIIQLAVRKSPKDLKDSRNFFPSGNSTLAEIKPEDLEIANKLLFKPYFNTEIILEDETKQVVENVSYKAPLNQIFYGPPGTGKTYNTILEAAKIITQDETISYEAALGIFNKHLGGRIEFITFHQNYSYEDFIQGLRPDTELSGELSFFKSDGVFKKIADKALKNLKDAENPNSVKKEFTDVFSELIKPLNELDIGEVEIKMKQTSFYITEVGEKSIEFRKNQGDSKHTLSIATLKKMYDKGANDIILGGLQPYYNPILKQLLELGKRNVEQVQKQNYVIIIDEINRANISRVFGELITLIEKDKRSHGKIPLTATLPSGEPFIVPSNLYIIGTMNTADKSIALLDIALRRRFEFKAMYPKYEIQNIIIHKAAFLQKLNMLIVNSGKGHDFTIGHSYFMDEDIGFNFENTINNKVIPLLLEYYMNDEVEVTKILNEALKEDNYKIGNWPLEIIDNGN
ncbi:AAA domain-containing protein [Bizionia saleffrena]|uniref:AAA domain-containing protein n=1 Tax=Bizionia saleffrena TaxID=291189 RepID=A0A8H2QMR4_9FLAO|nr:AAA family ATPase [Bizionia saleffrena]TYB78108.1 AAA domain-containing protein [Bizionia saleffrena]